MNDIFEFHEGKTPLLVSIPHDGRALPPEVASRLTPAARTMPDTDWYVGRLYGFARELGASVIAARYSRYVVDLNRPENDEALYPGHTTGLVPTTDFAGQPLYAEHAVPDEDERRQRAVRYWRPYHLRIEAELERLKQRHGHALLWDAHSIRSEVPALFDGALPVLNLGTYGGASCAASVEAAVMRLAEGSPYSGVLNGRFKGGFITRHYGAPAHGVHAIQLELAQRAYMDEASLCYDEQRAVGLRAFLRTMFETFLAAGAGAATPCP